MKFSIPPFQVSIYLQRESANWLGLGNKKTLLLANLLQIHVNLNYKSLHLNNATIFQHYLVILEVFEIYRLPEFKD